MIFMLVLIIASFFFYIYPKHVGQGIKMSSFDPCCKKTTLPNRILSFSLHSHCGHSLALASETGSCWTWHNKISFPNWVHSL